MVEWGYVPTQHAWLFESQYFDAALLLLASLVIAWAFKTTFVKALKKLTEKTETDIDDIIISIASRPIFCLILLLGLFFSLRLLRVLDPYRGAIDGVFFVLTVLLVSWMVSRIFALLTARWFQAKTNLNGSPRLLNIIAAVVIYICAIIIILAHFHVEITPFIAALGVGGLAVGLALQDTLGNVFAGLHIISDQPVRVDDVIEIHDEKITGTVQDIGWRSTRITTLESNVIIVPNSRLANSIITNYQMPEQDMQVYVECGVAYDQDLSRVEQVSLEVAREVQEQAAGAVKGFSPVVRFHTFVDSNVNFRTTLSAKSRMDKRLVEHEFVKRLHKRFAQEGIEISWPVRKVYQMPAQPSKPSSPPVQAQQAPAKAAAAATAPKARAVNAKAAAKPKAKGS